ncbi:MAG: DUF1801 domain-containing protein [Weeksellaceae bacterium]|nr:DUF1801 domain-containing protein [Weeksellaceae bacterium]
MAKNKTTETDLSVEDYINQISDEKRRNDIKELVKIFGETSDFPAKMWGTAIVGFGSYHYKYASGHEGDAPLVALSSRVAQISLYLYPDSDDKADLLKELGKFKMAKACIYVKKNEDINFDILRKLIHSTISKIRNFN